MGDLPMGEPNVFLENVSFLGTVGQKDQEVMSCFLGPLEMKTQQLVRRPWKRETACPLGHPWLPGSVTQREKVAHVGAFVPTSLEVTSLPQLGWNLDESNFTVDIPTPVRGHLHHEMEFLGPRGTPSGPRVPLKARNVLCGFPTRTWDKFVMSLCNEIEWTPGGAPCKLCQECGRVGSRTQIYCQTVGAGGEDP